MSQQVECPLCEQLASKTLTVEMGDSWRDTLGKPPVSLFSDYLMIHAAPTQGGVQLFLHSERDLQGG